VHGNAVTPDSEGMEAEAGSASSEDEDGGDETGNRREQEEAEGTENREPIA
jgi:hypothetical protein